MRKEKSGNRKWNLRPVIVIVLLLAFGRCDSSIPAGNGDFTFTSYPKEGDTTKYGTPLSIDNTARFIEYYNQYELTSDQDAVKKEALTALVAPCCDDNTMYTCCCPCNLAKSVWGLSAHLIVDKDYDASAVREAALQWLRFIRPDYYKVQELIAAGLDPRAFGLTPVNSCYDGMCELPFSQGGCGGMNELKLN